MRRGYPAVVAAAGSVVLVASIAVGLSQFSGASAAESTATPTPVTTSVQVSVIIPEPGGSGGGGSGSGTNTKPPTSTPAPAACTPSVDGKPPVAPSQPSDKAGKLTLDHETIAANEWMVAKGGGYTPGEQVQVVIYSAAQVVGSYKADAAGNVVARFRVPLETRPGDHVVEASGWKSCVANKADFSVVTNSIVAAFPYLWWIIIVVSVLVTGIVVTAIYFRRSIGRSFGGGLPATEPLT